MNIQTAITFPPPRFNGSDYVPALDDVRLGKQYTAIFNLMGDKVWRTLKEIEIATGYPQSSISAQLRHMRKPRFGGHTVEKQKRGSDDGGLFEYRLVVNG